MKYLSLIFLASLICFSSSSQDAKVRNIPSWVRQNQPDLDWEQGEEELGGYYYLLVDYQDNIPLENVFWKNAIKILNNEGVQRKSDISIIYDPKYEDLSIHEIKVYRGDQVFDKLADHEIRTFHRERSGDRYLYDGRLEAVINLRDIRVGDIIVYSYSRKGYNPVYKGHRSSVVELAYHIPVLKVKNRIIEREGRPLTLKYTHKVVEPEILNTVYGKEYHWMAENTVPIYYDKNVPNWYNAYNDIAYTDFGSWEEVVETINPLYEIDQEVLSELKEALKDEITSQSKDSIVSQAIRFVQDKVRYLGFEDGIHAFKPHSPLQVLNQRFGDCKDKSFLLCSTLNAFGVEAYPVLVNTSNEEHILDKLPGFGVFNHCVAQIKLDSAELYIDPTINYQGGQLSTIPFPDYGAGLVLHANANDLTKIQKFNERGSKISQHFTVQNDKDSILLQIVTESYDSEADRNRSYFATTNTEKVAKNYLNYYSAEYPGIKINKPISYVDDRLANKFIIEEEYLIPNFGKPSEEDNSLIEFDFYALDFENYLYPPKSPARTMPYASPNRLDYTQELRLTLPGKPSGYLGQQTFESDHYNYEYSSDISGNEVFIKHHYQTFSKYIEADEVDKYLSKHKEMKNYLSYLVTYDLNESLPFSFSPYLLIILVMVLTVGGILSRKLYYGFDLKPRFELRRGRSIGGFLIVIAVLIVLQLLLFLFSLSSSSGYFNAGVWELINSSTNSSGVQVLLAATMIYETIRFVFLIMLMISFLQLRVVFPRITTLFIFVNLVYTVAFGILYELLSAEKFGIGISGEEVFYTVVISIICILYLKRSPRVEETFINSLSE